MQPAFYYATLTMLITLVSSFLLIRINYTLSPRWKSVMIVLPLVLSLAVVLWLSPTLTRGARPEGVQTFFVHLSDGTHLQGIAPMYPFLPLIGPANDKFLSISGTIILIKLLLGTLSLTFSVLVGDCLPRRLLRVVELSPGDFPELWTEVADLSAALSIRMPRLGLVEDLRPSAFTFGYGRGTMVVFSLGILDLLDRQELRAVAAHELSHVKNRDVWFRTAIRALSWVQFFNPASHLSVRAAQRAKELLKLVGLADREDHRPSRLSAGEQQRVSIARALANRPPLLLADEPTGNLDSKNKVEIVRLIRRLSAEQNMTSVMVTHDNRVASQAWRVIFIKDGQVRSNKNRVPVKDMVEEEGLD